VKSSRRRAFAPWLALAAVLVVALVVLFARSQPSDSVEARSNRIARQIKCPDCQGESVANSGVAIARGIRADIRSRVEHGESDDEIIAYYVSQYPDARLSPDGGGIGFFAWGIPVIAIVVALGALALALRRWSSTPRLAASDDDERLVDRARSEGHA
jgi:cytochrome c-type biogenesis protein CcmH